MEMVVVTGTRQARAKQSGSQAREGATEAVIQNATTRQLISPWGMRKVRD